VAWVLSVQVTRFHEDIERSFAATGLDARDPLHLGRRFQVLVVVCLVDEDVIDAEFVDLC